MATNNWLKNFNKTLGGTAAGTTAFPAAYGNTARKQEHRKEMEAYHNKPYTPPEVDNIWRNGYNKSVGANHDSPVYGEKTAQPLIRQPDISTDAFKKKVQNQWYNKITHGSLKEDDWFGGMVKNQENAESWYKTTYGEKQGKKEYNVLHNRLVSTPYDKIKEEEKQFLNYKAPDFKVPELTPVKYSYVKEQTHQFDNMSENIKEFLPNKGGTKILGRFVQLQAQYDNSENIEEKESCVKEVNVIRDLERANQSHKLQKYPIMYKYDTVDAIDILKKYDKQISLVSETVNIPKTMIASVLYREMMCYKIDDSVDWLKQMVRGDASMGLGQIFISTAQAAEKNFYGEVQYNDAEMKKRLLNDETNIYYVGLVLRHCADELGIVVDINYNYSDVDKIFARYNGYGNAALKYGKETTEYANAIYNYYGGR